MRDAQYFTELYWYACVVDLGSYSAAAEQAGVSNSSLSRRIKQLEERLGVQLLNRNTRKLVMTSVGEEVYRHALAMLSAAHAAELVATDTLAQPAGLMRIAGPGILSDWLMDNLQSFKSRHPLVRYELYLEEDIDSSATQPLDLHLTLQPPPNDSSDLVVHPLGTLKQGLIANPHFIAKLKPITCVSQLVDQYALAYGTSLQPQPWQLQQSTHALTRPALASTNLQALRDAARAGIGVACLPLLACQDDLLRNTLAVISTDDPPAPLTLNALTPSFRGITPATRQLIESFQHSLAAANSEQPFHR